MNKMPHRPATIQVDVDPFWFIAQIMQRPIQEQATIYQAALPLYLDAFAGHGVKATFFIVGKDLEDERNLPVLERMLAEGHELANHSYSHDTKLKWMPPEKAAREIDRCSELMEKRFGVVPKGFKSPAYGIGPGILDLLQERGYAYDSSVHPSLASPLVKGVQRFWLRYRQGASEYGRWRAATAPQAPYRPDETDIYRRGNRPILEIPVSTMPGIRLPFHFSYVNIGGMGLYRAGALLEKLAQRRFLNYAFHAVDILDPSRAPVEIHKRPGLGRPGSDKLANLHRILDDLTSRYDIFTSREIAAGHGT